MSLSSGKADRTVAVSQKKYLVWNLELKSQCPVKTAAIDSYRHSALLEGERNMDKAIKQQVRDLLSRRKVNELLDLCEKDRRFWSAVRLFLYETDDSICWSAIEVTAELMKRWWKAGREEKVREYIRSLMWLLSDESGGIGWSAPQTIAEIIVAIPELLEPYSIMAIARALEEPPLVKSGLWAMGHLGKRISESVGLVEDMISDVFISDEPETLGLAAWAMGEVGFAPALPFLEALKDRQEPVRIYIDGDFHEKLLGLWAKEAIDKIE